jgi:hypothetical protein
MATQRLSAGLKAGSAIPVIGGALIRARNNGRTSRAFLPRLSLLAGLALAATTGGPASAELIQIANGYHAQQTPFYCGPASMQMMLDSPAVQALNPGLPSQNALYAASRPFNVVPIFGTDPIAFAATKNLADGLDHRYAWYDHGVKTSAGRSGIPSLSFHAAA